MEAPATLRARKAVMWTREDCGKLEGMGLLPERWELVQGEIVSKMETNLPHSMIAKRMDVWLSNVFPTDRILPTCSIDVGKAYVTFIGKHYASASAPPIISINSFVIAA